MEQSELWTKWCRLQNQFIVLALYRGASLANDANPQPKKSPDGAGFHQGQ